MEVIFFSIWLLTGLINIILFYFVKKKKSFLAGIIDQEGVSTAMCSLPLHVHLPFLQPSWIIF